MPKKTREEIEALKKDWFRDPCWDIEDTEGFEGHRKELAEFHKQSEAKWTEDARKRDQAEDARVRARAQELDCAPAVVRLIEDLEAKVKALQDDVATLQEQAPVPSPSR